MTPTAVRNASMVERGFVRKAGWLCLIGALVGVAGGLVTAVYPAQVPSDRFSYPYTTTGFLIAESSFLLNHLLLLAGLLALARSRAVGDGRYGRVGSWVAVAGMAGLAMSEVWAMTFKDSAYPTPETGNLDASYGISTILIGIGLLVAGVAAARAGVWTGWQRYVVLALGVAVFVMVIPGVMAPFLVGRLVLTVWMLMFAGLGLALLGARPPSDRD